MLKNFQRPTFFWAGTEGQRYNAQKFSEANFFWAGTEVQRYNAPKFSEVNIFLPGTQVQRYNAPFLCFASEDFEKKFELFDQGHRYRGTMVQNSVPVNILKKSLNFFDKGQRYRGTLVQSPKF